MLVSMVFKLFAERVVVCLFSAQSTPSVDVVTIFTSPVNHYSRLVASGVCGRLSRWFAIEFLPLAFLR